ncbi:MAG: hypothetical protein AB1641_09895 [Thermodesulfobacteriota bacterium]
MAQPDIRETIVAGPLANVSIAYRNKSYIADRIFRIVDKVAPKALIARYLKSAWFRDEAAIRGPGAEAVRGGYPTDYLSANLKEYAFAKEVTDEDRRYSNVAGAPPLKPDQDALEFCADKIDLRHERLVANLVLTGTWSGVAGEDAEGGWAHGASPCTFISDVETRIETIRGNTGLRPNVLVLSANTLAEVKQDSSVLDRIKYTERGIVTPDLIAALFGLEACLVGDAIYSSAKETKAGTEWTAYNVWEKNAGKGSAYLCYRPPAPGLKVPAAGYICRGAYESGQPRRNVTWREAARHQDVYEVAEEIDIVQTGPDLGFFWYDTILT